LGGDFAIASTDDGHETAGVLDTLWADDQGLRVDFGYRAVHVLAVASKAIITAYYGQAPTDSYFAGCSDGGREGLMEAQRYPDDFNGIIVGSPAYIPTVSDLIAWAVDSNTDSAGNVILTADKVLVLHSAVIAACDANDGIPGDGLIGDPRDCDFNPASIECPGVDAPTCLTAAQVKVAQEFYSGPKDPSGQLLFPGGLDRGSELSWLGWIIPIPPAAGSPPGTQPTWEARDAIQASLEHLVLPPGKGVSLSQWSLSASNFESLRQSASIMDPLNPDLTQFRNHGGKLLIYQGWADTLAHPQLTIDYYNAMTRTMGGLRRTARRCSFRWSTG
jgi:hypothetical protein